MRTHSCAHIIRIAWPYHLMIICVCLLIWSVSLAMVFDHSKCQRMLLRHEPWNILFTQKEIGAASEKNLSLWIERVQEISISHILSTILYACVLILSSPPTIKSILALIWLPSTVDLTHVRKHKEIDEDWKNRDILMNFHDCPCSIVEDFDVVLMWYANIHCLPYRNAIAKNIHIIALNQLSTRLSRIVCKMKWRYIWINVCICWHVSMVQKQCITMICGCWTR